MDWTEVGVYQVVAILGNEHLLNSPLDVRVAPQRLHLPLARLVDGDNLRGLLPPAPLRSCQPGLRG